MNHGIIRIYTEKPDPKGRKGGRRVNRRKGDISLRRAGLLEMIRNLGGEQLDIPHTARLLGVSEVTLRRDLAALAAEGLVERGYGRVAAVEDSDQSKISTIPESIQRISQMAAQFVADGDIIFVNTSRTALHMLRYIEAENVTVITNNVLATTVPHRSDMTLILTGGEVRYPKYAMVGDVAQKTIQSIRANKAFLGCSGLSVDKGVTTEFFAEVGVNSKMLQNVSGPVFLLASHVKLNWDSNFVSGPISYVSTLITDKGAPAELIAPFEALDIMVYQV